MERKVLNIYAYSTLQGFIKILIVKQKHNCSSHQEWEKQYLKPTWQCHNQFSLQYLKNFFAQIKFGEENHQQLWNQNLLELISFLHVMV